LILFDPDLQIFNLVSIPFDRIWNLISGFGTTFQVLIRTEPRQKIPFRCFNLLELLVILASRGEVRRDREGKRSDPVALDPISRAREGARWCGAGGSTPVISGNGS
jgi:hypothetical protein